MSEKVVFRERQVLSRNIRLFTLVPLFLILTFLSYGFVQQVILGVPFGSNPDTDVHLIVPWIIVFLAYSFRFVYSHEDKRYTRQSRRKNLSRL